MRAHLHTYISLDTHIQKYFLFTNFRGYKKEEERLPSRTALGEQVGKTFLLLCIQSSRCWVTKRTAFWAGWRISLQSPSHVPSRQNTPLLRLMTQFCKTQNLPVVAVLYFSNSLAARKFCISNLLRFHKASRIMKGPLLPSAILWPWGSKRALGDVLSPA